MKKKKINYNIYFVSIHFYALKLTANKVRCKRKKKARRSLQLKNTWAFLHESSLFKQLLLIKNWASPTETA